ncbi:UDP-2,4-diacetamido-2,4,6-trideoxy-beta-L-altropyranose hydrolase [Pokkaliibacter sp. CJK22405]|uniref:UDP-2,4-diacetamido-2,4, 6-trideoxy-beta-L-altropyranose hydrolase n=1 Tax=Pokkaliibacter sp. CJK22405 TaxID=3384615 RepID=UPI0039850C0E
MRVLFRVDASGRMGGGHWLRSMALAQACLALSSNCESAVFWCFAEGPQGLQQRLVSLGIQPYALAVEPSSTADAEATIALARSLNADWLVLDGYHFSATYRQQLTAGLHPACRVLWIDDLFAAEEAHVDWVLNSTALAQEDDYGQARVLAGLDYVLLREDYWQPPTPADDCRSLFVNFGATDAFGLTLPVIELLGRAGITTPVEVVTGPGVENAPEIAARCEALGFIHHHDLPSLTPVLARSQLALTAAGSTLHELAYWQIPSVLLIVADNQLASAHWHQDKGWCQSFDARSEGALVEAVATASHLLENTTRRQLMQKAAHGIIDGQGARRVAALMQEAIAR